MKGDSRLLVNPLQSEQAVLAELVSAGTVFFVLRGFPGFGRVVQGLILSDLLHRVNRLQNHRFFSSGPGKQYLEGRGLEVDELSLDFPDFHQGPSGLLDSGGFQALLEEIDSRRPGAVVIDGNPILIPILRRMFGGVLLGIANEYDLHNPTHGVYQRRGFQLCYTSCDLVIVAAIAADVRRYSLHGTPILSIPALVDPELLTHGVLNSEPAVAAVIGGGSIGDTGLANESRKIRDSVFTSARSMPYLSFYLIAGGLVGEPVAPPDNVSILTRPDEIAKKMRDCSMLIARAGRSTVAEALALEKRAILIPAVGKNPWRAAEQHHNAVAASRISNGIVLIHSEDLGQLGTTIRKLPDLRPSAWTPGNELLLELVTP